MILPTLHKNLLPNSLTRSKKVMAKWYLRVQSVIGTLNRKGLHFLQIWWRCPKMVGVWVRPCSHWYKCQSYIWYRPRLRPWEKTIYRHLFFPIFSLFKWIKTPGCKYAEILCYLRLFKPILVVRQSNMRCSNLRCLYEK